jgi:hypothetical protein
MMSNVFGKADQEAIAKLSRSSAWGVASRMWMNAQFAQATFSFMQS